MAVKQVDGMGRGKFCLAEGSLDPKVWLVQNIFVTSCLSWCQLAHTHWTSSFSDEQRQCQSFEVAILMPVTPYNYNTQYTVIFCNFNMQCQHHHLPQNCSQPICLQDASESLTDSSLHASLTSFYIKVLTSVYTVPNYINVYTGTFPLS